MSTCCQARRPWTACLPPCCLRFPPSPPAFLGWAMPLITLEAVSYCYPEAERPALLDVSAAVEPGQVILLRGPSGSGKSTLLRCLNGLVPHSTGGQIRRRGGVLDLGA